MRHDFLTMLQENAPTFSKGQRRIAAYITEAYDKAAFMTANRLGKVVGVSESTVVRFAMELFLKFYSIWSKEMQYHPYLNQVDIQTLIKYHFRSN